MKRLRLPAALCALLCAGLLPSALHADELDDLGAALRKSAEALRGQSEEAINATLRQIAELEGALAQGETGRVRTAAQQIVQNPAASAEVKKSAQRLERELPGLLAARSDAFVNAVETIVERTRRESLEAKTEGDLLPLLRDLSALQLRQPPRASAPVVERAVRKLDAATKCVGLWMDYLLASSQGNGARAKELLGRMIQDSSTYPLLPHGEYEKRLAGIAERGEPLSRLAELLVKIRTLQDVEPMGPEIDAALKPPRNIHYAGVDVTQRWFDEFRSAVAAYLSGDLGEAWRRANTTFNTEANPAFGQMLRLRTMLLDELVPKVLNLPPGAERRPNETFADHLRRVLAAAAAQGHWEEVVRLTVARPVTSYAGRVVDPAVELGAAAAAYVEARRFEAAGDFPGAIVAYERVLKSTAELAPVREATERLKTLRQSQPGAFSEVHPRLESDRVTELLGQLDRTVSLIGNRLVSLERERAAVRSPEAPSLARASPVPAGPPAAPNPAAAGLDAAEKSALEARLDRLEILLGPGAEALANRAPEKQMFRIWLGQDYTVYRSALPKKLEADLTWSVRYNGRFALRRRASGEFFFRYPDLKPGAYSVTLISGSNDVPVSNVLEFPITDEAAQRGPKVFDNDVDRDGVPSANEGRNR